ncbi:YheC/YheD family protein [Paenibacillus hexagrammi]|uniref:YheC/YheD family protein n=1 Tax=Paenibacillus hexagrammi TaxID=2908839 RepID=A0ABY3SG42_9BACL|nr:YheC/YheD family protein [Paenibacillus sp. YPD9-1]UJF32405.1 YheC/YheD family protein [Paenibacillus sp. YPD9-1]
MSKILRRHINSKWAKTKAIQTASRLETYIPLTKRMTYRTLKQMLHKHRMVYIKPDSGMFGNGVMRVEWHKGRQDQSYFYQEGETPRSFGRFVDMYRSIRKLIGKRRYLVQRGIELLTYKGNRFDIRVMVQQSPVQEWETTGIIGRVAHPRKIVTNFHNGGALKDPGLLLQGYMADRESKKLMHRLQLIGLHAAKAMQSRFKGVNEIGVDVAIDHKLHPWILEVNTSPDPYIFRRLRDKRVYAKVMQYAKSNGRVKPKNR